MLRLLGSAADGTTSWFFAPTLEVPVSLHGSLETFPLTEVIGLLAGTAKTGALQVDGSVTRGRLWFAAGQVVATEADGPAGPAADDVDAVFELLRMEGGTFRFDADDKTARAGVPVDAQHLLVEATARLDEWRAIEAVVPSLRHRLHLVAEPAGEEITVSAARWKTLVTITTTGTASGVADALGLSSLEACRKVRDLVEAGLVEVTEPDAAAEVAPVAAAAAVAAVDAVEEAPAADAPIVPVDPWHADLEVPVAPLAPPAAVEEPAAAEAVLEADEAPAPVEAIDPFDVQDQPDVVAETAPEGADWRTWGDDTWNEGTTAGADDDPWASYTNTTAEDGATTTMTTSAPVETALEAPVEDGELTDEDQINRGLLLKFLSSVRS